MFLTGLSPARTLNVPKFGTSKSGTTSFDSASRLEEGGYHLPPAQNKQTGVSKKTAYERDRAEFNKSGEVQAFMAQQGELEAQPFSWLQKLAAASGLLGVKTR